MFYRRRNNKIIKTTKNFVYFFTFVYMLLLYVFIFVDSLLFYTIVLPF